MRDQRGRIFQIAHQSGHIAHKNQTSCFQCDGYLRCGDIGVAVIKIAFRVLSRGADDRSDIIGDAIQNLRRVHSVDFAHKADIQHLPVLTGNQFLFAFQHFASGKTFSLAAKALDRLHNARIDLIRKDFLHHIHGLLISHAHTLDEPGFDAGILQCACDRLAAAVDYHRVDPDRFQECDITGNTVPLFGILRVHETASILDDESLTAIALDIRQRFQQKIGPYDQLIQSHIYSPLLKSTYSSVRSAV